MSTQINRDEVEHLIEEINEAYRQMQERYDARVARPVITGDEDLIELKIHEYEALSTHDTPAGTESLEQLHELCRLGRAVGIRTSATFEVWPTSTEVQ
ncbi:hypothetical protein ACFVBP_10475 [Nocardioides sp. NPDC057764]|uniref:hypothetical protein n=1 Tax=Nocardioides sp. NPDC057764 TaxID=3346243 RepID=UPI00366EFD64